MNNFIDIIKKIQKKAIYCYKNEIPYFIVIHGYNNGCVLMDTISNIRNLHCKVISYTERDVYNMGRTFVWIKKK